MLYAELAQRFNELDIIADLINRLEYLDKPLEELRRENFIAYEFHRIKTATIQGIFIFGDHSDKYLKFHISLLYSLTIKTIEIIKELSCKMYLNKREEYQFKHFSELHVWLGKLIIFYENLNLSFLK